MSFKWFGYENMRFQSNEKFIYSISSSILSSKPKNGEKDSLVISVAEYSIIS